MHQVKRTVTPVLVDAIYLFSVFPEFSLFFSPKEKAKVQISILNALIFNTDNYFKL